MKRRTFLKNTAIAGGTLLGGHVAPGPSHIPIVEASDEQPNILIIVVDQLRYPQWFPNQEAMDAYLPAMARLRTSSVNFSRHYTAAAACTPARGCLTTGLYSHQTRCLRTITSPNMAGLNVGFPTWGTLLRELGYRTFWYGKWHLSTSRDLNPYGFDGAIAPVQEIGIAHDVGIVDQFIDWLDVNGVGTPWCTTVSLINPHDIAGYYRFTDTSSALSDPPSIFTELPPNFETPNDLLAQHKPRVQLAQNEFSQLNFGVLPHSGSDFKAGWLKLLDLYLHLQQRVDAQIGRVLDALEAHSSASNTIILFTSDHGEYGGSHGLRGKAGAAYEESIRVPLYIKDPTGKFAVDLSATRTQLTSSVDIVPLLLTLASGGNTWRKQPAYAHLARRLDLTSILRDPAAPGRPYVLHTSDEDKIKGELLSPNGNAPPHVIACRTTGSKLGLANFWTPDSLRIEAKGQEAELYDYQTEGGRLEIDNVAETNTALYSQLFSAVAQEVIPNELRRPLPAFLIPAQLEAHAAYLAESKEKVFLPFITN